MPMAGRMEPLPPGAQVAERHGPVADALREQLAGGDPQIAAFYAARRYRPLWIQGWRLTPDVRAVIRAVAHARDDGLDPADYGMEGLPEVMAEAQSGRPADLARAEIALSRAAAGYLSDLHALQPGAGMIYADPSLAPPRLNRTGVLQALERGPSPAAAVDELRRMNPIYEELRDQLAAWRAKGGDSATERLIRINLERARALPADPGARYILVDAAAQQLWLFQDGQAVDSMPVIVGKPSQPTPSMAGIVRYAVARPYWNVPPDLVQDSIAPKARRNPNYLESKNMEALSDWTPEARVLLPSEIDWRAVAAGRQVLRVRQRPGPNNMMGEVKFVFPNSFGVYLHDTPLRQYFAKDQRAESSGCVRLADAPRLARWLIPDKLDELAAPGLPETRLDLAQPVPVYIVYLTVAPGADGLLFRTDIYRRDQALMARLGERHGKA